MRRDNENTIGLFPLRIFLLPGEQTTLHIYEPQYLQLIMDCDKGDVCFGIPFQGKTTLSEFGSLVWVSQILKVYETGELDIMVECKQNFKINTYEHVGEEKDYPQGSVTLLRAMQADPAPDLQQVVGGYLKLLHGEDFKSDFQDNLQMRNIIKMLNLTNEEKVKFMKMVDGNQQNLFLLRKIKFLAILLQQEKNIESNFYLN